MKTFERLPKKYINTRADEMKVGDVAWVSTYNVRLEKNTNKLWLSKSGTIYDLENKRFKNDFKIKRLENDKFKIFLPKCLDKETAYSLNKKDKKNRFEITEIVFN